MLKICFAADSQMKDLSANLGLITNFKTTCNIVIQN